VRCTALAPHGVVSSKALPFGADFRRGKGLHRAASSVHELSVVAAIPQSLLLRADEMIG
jgi:hypothetical protein